MLITISMKLSILYLKGSEFHIKCISFIHEDCFYRSNLADPDQMQPYTTFHLGLHCLPKVPVIRMIISMCTR